MFIKHILLKTGKEKQNEENNGWWSTEMSEATEAWLEGECQQMHQKLGGKNCPDPDVIEMIERKAATANNEK